MKIRSILGLFVPVALLALALSLGSILLLRLFFVATLVSFTSFLWALLNIRNLNLRTGKPPEHLQVGNSFQREVVLENTGKFPRLWLKLLDNTDLPGKRDSTMVTIPGKSSQTWRTELTCRRRGRYHLGPTTITSTDPFGIFQKERILGQKQDVTVYPATIDLPLFRFTSFSDFGYGSGYQSISRISPNASSVREYASGDSLHHIHWRSTARTGALMVKMFDADRSHNASKTAWVLLDMNQASHAGQDEENSEEYAVTIAASVVNKYLQGGMRVGLIATDDKRTFIPVERGEEQLWTVMESLALMKTGPQATLSEVVAENLDSFRDNPLVIAVATSVSETLLEAIHQMRNRVDSVVVVLLDITSFGGKQAFENVSRSLTWLGARVYTIRKDEEIARALDSRTTHIHPLTV